MNRVIKRRNIAVFVFIISISTNIDNCLGQSWRTNDRIETFRTRQRIENQLVCAEKDTTFELVTGYVFTAPDSILDTYPGMFHLEECINKCSKDAKCLAVNYETGLCVLFSDSADSKPEALSPSQFPVFTMYATKICIRNAKEECSFPHHVSTTKLKRPQSSAANPRNFGMDETIEENTRSWSFDRIHQHQLVGFVRKRFRVKRGRQECMELCLSEQKFICRSANYNKETRVCELSDMDRHTTSSTSSIIPNINVDYFESNCLSFDAKNEDRRNDNDDKTNNNVQKNMHPFSNQHKKNQELSCNFKPTKGRILKTVDAVYQNVTTLEECRLKCVNANFRCYSYDYGDTGVNVCRLSHHASSTLYLIDEPYIRSETAITYERGSCYNVTIECQSAYMVAHVRTNRVFSGRMYGRTRPNSCVVDIDRSLDFELKLGYNDIDCDVVNRGPGKFTSEVVIQHHDTIVTSSDVGLRIRCNYNLTNRTVTHTSSLEVNDGQGGGNGLGEAAMQTTAVAAPNVTMRITMRNGNDITSAKVGDHLALRFEIEDAKSSPYEIFVRELVASDGVDTSEILLIDDRGCPTDYTIMREVQEVNGNGQTLQTNFDAFKFPTSDVVQFRALVTPCIPRCDPVRCDVSDYLGHSHLTKSYGRRRRKRSDDTSERGFREDYSQRPNSRKMPKPVELKVASLIHISDKFDETSVLDDRLKDNTNSDSKLEEKLNETYSESNNNMGSYSSSQDWEHQSQSFEESEHAETCKVTHEEKCTNDMYTMTIGATIFLVAQCILIAVWVIIYHKQKHRSPGVETVNKDENMSPSMKYEAWSRLNNRQNFIFDHLKSKSSVKTLKSPDDNYQIQPTYTDFDPYLPTSHKICNPSTEPPFPRKNPTRATISTSRVETSYNNSLTDMNSRNERGRSTDRQLQKNQSFNDDYIEKDNLTNQQLPFSYCEPSSFTGSYSGSRFVYQPSPLSSLDSFFHSSQSDESHRTASTSLTASHRSKYEEDVRRVKNVKEAPVKPKRVSKA